MLQKTSKFFAVAIKMRNLHTSEMPIGNKITVLLDDRQNHPDANTPTARRTVCITIIHPRLTFF